MLDLRLHSALPLVLVLSLLVPGLAAAQDSSSAEAPAAPNWIVNCTNAPTGGALHCTMSQSVVLTDTGARLLMVTVQTLSGADSPTMTVTLPHGLFLPAGLRMFIDDEEQETSPIQTCDASGCYAGGPIDRKLLRKMKRGTVLRFVIQDVQKRDIDLKLKLGGFTASFALLER